MTTSALKHTGEGVHARPFHGHVTRSFRLEHQAVLAGRLRFRGEEVEAPEGSSSLLRRNIHRLEKGLSMRPLRPVFGLDYLEETVQCYTTAHAREGTGRGISEGEMKWARDVLTLYFASTGSHPVIERNRQRFLETAPAPESRGDKQFAPYRRELARGDIPSWDSLEALAWRRRSVRWFLPDPVPRDLIRRAIHVGTLAPTACNRQPFVFRVFDDPALIARLVHLPGGTKGFETGIPVIIAVVGRLSNYFHERDRHLIYIDASLAIMGFLLAAETLGLATCCLNWPDYPDREYAARDLLRLEPGERPVMFIALGFPDPDGLVPYSKKKPNEQVCRFNFEGKTDA